MTGFGRAEHRTELYDVKVEMHSVNRKNSEVVFQLPKPLLEIESDLRKKVSEQILRGRIQVNLTVELLQKEEANTSVDHVKLQALVKACEEMSKATNQEMKLEFADVIRIGGVVSLEVYI